MAAVRLGLAPRLRVIGANVRRMMCNIPLQRQEPKYVSCYSLNATSVRYFHAEAQDNQLSTERKYVESQDPEEWKFVERLLPHQTVPIPLQQDEYPSGWFPPREASKLPYFIGRSKNHMPSVYLRVGFRGIGKRTVVKRIKGDIWALERDLRDYLERNANSLRIVSQVNEMCEHIVFKGDHVSLIIEWIKTKGF